MAKKQETEMLESEGGREERKGVRENNPQPTPLGSAPRSPEGKEGEKGQGGEEWDDQKPMPVDAEGEGEPPLSRCRSVSQVNDLGSEQGKLIIFRCITASGSDLLTSILPPRVVTTTLQLRTSKRRMVSHSPTSLYNPTKTSRIPWRCSRPGSSITRRKKPRDSKNWREVSSAF